MTPSTVWLVLRALISRGTGLSVAFDSIPLLSQILAPKPTPNFGFSAYCRIRDFTEGRFRTCLFAARVSGERFCARLWDLPSSLPPSCVAHRDRVQACLPAASSLAASPCG